MEIRRKAIYALITSAVMLNVGFGLINNGMPSSIQDMIENMVSDPNDQGQFVVPPLKEGGIYSSNYNMTLNIEMDNDPEEGSGTYSIQGIATRSILRDRIKKDLRGAYELSYRYNETDDISILGDLKRSRETIISEGGIPTSEKVSTIITVAGPKGIGSTSKVGSDLRDVSSLRSDLIWKALIPSNGTLSRSMRGSIETDLNLQEAGLSFSTLALQWRVEGISNHIDGSRALIKASSNIGQKGEVSISLTMLEDCAWPESMSIEIHGTFMTDEGAASIDMIIKEELFDWSIGEGAELPFTIYDPLGPPNDDVSSGGHVLVPDEGGETPFRSAPMEAVEFCLEEGYILSELNNDHSGDLISTIDLVYEKNDTVDRMWTWNITMAAPPVEGISDIVTFEVGVEGGGIIDKKRFTLISEQKGSGFRYVDPNREMITLYENDEILRGTESGDIFFRSEDHSSSYRLDIIRRGNTGSDVGSVLFMNMLGVEKAQVKDVFISRVLDRTNPSKMYIVVIDGTEGDLISTTTLEGAGVPLFNAYDFDLA